MKRSLASLLIATMVCSLAVCSTSTLARGQEAKIPMYFPIGAVSDFEQTWYASHLSAMIEPVLSATGKPPGYFALRVLFLPTWDHPVAFRYETDGVNAVRRAVMLSGEGGYDPGKIKVEHSTHISQQDLTKLLSSLDQSGYWTLQEKDDVGGADGSQLVVETIRNGRHRVLVRWTPSYKADSRKLAGLVALYAAEFKNAGFWSDPIE